MEIALVGQCKTLGFMRASTDITSGIVGLVQKILIRYPGRWVYQLHLEKYGGL